MKKITILMAAIVLSITGLKAQLADNSIAPDFKLKDVKGNVHHLYDYLNKGKTVIIDFSAIWCDPCWDLHSNGALEKVYNQYGPDGTIDTNMIVLFIEGNDGTLDELNGIGEKTRGNWLSKAEFPFFQTNSADSTGLVVLNYKITAFPTIYSICPDRKVKVMEPSSFDAIPTMFYQQSKTCFKSTYANDASLLNIAIPAHATTYCDNSITPKVLIQNLGTDTLKSLTVTVSNFTTEEVLSTYNWTGNISTYEIETVTLPEIAGIANGSLPYKFELSLPNGLDDEKKSDNSKNSFFKVQTDFSKFSIVLNTDDAPYEFSMDVKTGSISTIVFSVPEQSLMMESVNKTITYDLCLDPSLNQTFSFKDAGKNGGTVITIKKDGIDYFKKLIWSGSTSFIYTSNSKPISGINDNNELANVLEVYPNPTAGTLYVDNAANTNIQIFNIYGELMGSYVSNNDNYKIDLNAFNSGSYIVRVSNDKFVAQRQVVLTK